MRCVNSLLNMHNVTANCSIDCVYMMKMAFMCARNLRTEFAHAGISSFVFFYIYV